MKLEELLMKINYPSNYYDNLKNCSLTRVKVNKKSIKILLSSDEPIELNAYIKLESVLKDFFNIDSSVEVIVDNKGYKYVTDYFLYFTENDKYSFLRDKLKNSYNNYYIEVNNENEKNQLEEEQR